MGMRKLALALTLVLGIALARGQATCRLWHVDTMQWSCYAEQHVFSIAGFSMYAGVMLRPGLLMPYTSLEYAWDNYWVGLEYGHNGTKALYGVYFGYRW